jgi:hypothetical protein
MRWHERDHPRRPDGRFRHKGAYGGWVEAASDAMTRGHTPVRGADITETADFDHLDGDGSLSTGQQDERMLRLWAAQGFDGPPVVIDDAEWGRLVADGGVVMHRGVRGRKRGPSAAEMVELYASGDHYAGKGIYGNGSYFATEAQTGADYGTGDAFGMVTTTWPEQFESDYAVIEAMLLPDARVLDWRESKRLRQEVGRMDEYQTPETPRERVLADEGRMAAALGYDAIRVSLGGSYGDEIIVLNRTATAVRRR